MKVTKRKRKERRLRILEKEIIKRHAHEARVASGIRRDRARAHRNNLVSKYIDAEVKLRKTKEGPARKEKVRKLSFFARLLGRRS